MEFAIRNLSVLAYAQGFTLWHYRARGAQLAQTATTGFFNPAGDMMLVSANDGGQVLFVTDASETRGVNTTALAG